MRTAAEVFPLLAQKKVFVDTAYVAEGLAINIDVIKSRCRALDIEASLGMENAINDVILRIVSDQSNPEWWHALQKEHILANQTLSQWLDDPRFNTEIKKALRVVALAAAKAVWDILSGSDLETEWADASDSAAEHIDLQMRKLSKIALKEIGETGEEPAS